MVSQEFDSPMCQEIVNLQFYDTYIVIGCRELGHIFPMHWNLFRKRHDRHRLSVKFLIATPLSGTDDANPHQHHNGKDHELRTRTEI
jgi:hypothetical protein